MTTFHPDGPHSPEQTIAAADQMADLARYLNYSTRDGQAGLRTPADADSLVAALWTLAERLPQLCGQIASFLEAQHAMGRLADANGGDVDRLVTEARLWLDNLANRAGEMARAGHAVQNVISGLKVKGDDDG